MNHLQRVEGVEAVRLEVDSLGLESLLKRIETTLALVQTAETLYRLGSTCDADRFYARAWETYYGAKDELSNISIDKFRQRHLRDTLGNIRALLHLISP